MSDRKKLVVVVTNGLDNERSSVAWSIANGGVASDPDDFMLWWAWGNLSSDRYLYLMAIGLPIWMVGPSL